MRLPQWPVTKLVVLGLVGGFSMLVLELRYEHVDVLKHRWIPWIPIAYSALMVGVGAVGLARWEHGGRRVLLAAFAVSFIVGGLGLWFHNGPYLVAHLGEVLAAWTGATRHEDIPPPIAPLAFVGLGLLGLMACSRPFQPRPGNEG